MGVRGQDRVLKKGIEMDTIVMGEVSGGCLDVDRLMSVERCHLKGKKRKVIVDSIPCIYCVPGDGAGLYIEGEAEEGVVMEEEAVLGVLMA